MSNCGRNSSSFLPQFCGKMLERRDQDSKQVNIALFLSDLAEGAQTGRRLLDQEHDRRISSSSFYPQNLDCRP